MGSRYQHLSPAFLADAVCRWDAVYVELRYQDVTVPNLYAATSMLDVEKVITDKAEETRKTFRALLDKTNKEHPNPKDVRALSDLLAGNRKLELWRDVMSAGHLAELRVIENARATAAVKECWKHRLQVLKKGSGLRRRASTGETLDSTSCVVLVEAQSRGIELLRHHVTVDYFNDRSVLGETLESCSEAVHSSLRDSSSRSKTC